MHVMSDCVLWENMKNIISLSSAVFVHRVVNANRQLLICTIGQL